YESVQAFPDGAAFTNIMKRSGFSRNSKQALTLGISSIYVGYK
ncbi:MAG: class I SAM-dependent methyltransferase, partial [Bacteroidota bacterium]